MASSDPIGDMLAMIKNAGQRTHERISLPHSKIKESVATVLKKEGYVEDVKMTEEGIFKTLHIYLRYDEDRKPIIKSLKRVSKPGRRIVKGVDDIEKVLDGLGVSILTTSRGVLSDREARKARVGGEVICKVW